MRFGDCKIFNLNCLVLAVFLIFGYSPAFSSEESEQGSEVPGTAWEDYPAYEEIPETSFSASFSCDGRVGGYGHADPETMY
ncbi:MAG: hypothetical protein F6K24_32040, partial [Okeania sp. SIO2D1]|nr:hypothetical protein [Okeania sp. SIO2D1]